ncbi:MAG: GFA family protein [SAR324 cluster bacterium]|nr:GFA family protein [SAR324 cluster bacterium]
MKTAECSCGNLRVRVEGDPAMVLTCSCTACQRRTGSVFGVSAFFKESQAEIEGTPKVYARTGDSGGAIRVHFCPECGTSLYWLPDLVPGMIGVAVGCFLDPGFAAPQLAAYTRSRHHWVRFPDGIPHFETARSNT